MQVQSLADTDIEVAWLPSMPLINKRRAPSIAGVGILYSEDSDEIFDVFETSNLVQTLSTSTRRQSRALAQDPNCRICWLEATDKKMRKLAYKSLTAKARRLFNVG